MIIDFNITTEAGGGGAISKSFIVVDTLPTASQETTNKIYVIAADGEGEDHFDEYVTIDNGAEASPQYTWEQLGAGRVDIIDSVATTDVDKALSANMGHYIDTDLEDITYTIVKKFELEVPTRDWILEQQYISGDKVLLTESEVSHLEYMDPSYVLGAYREMARIYNSDSIISLAINDLNDRIGYLYAYLWPNE